MTTRLISLLTLLGLLAACSSNPPVVDYDKSIDFSAYRTFAFISDHPLIRSAAAGPESPLLEGHLMSAAEAAMQARGFTKVDDPESADFTVGFTVGARDKIKVNSYPEPYRPYYGAWGGGWGSPYYMGGMGGMGGTSNVDVQQYVEGTLAIDIYDVDAHKPAWHGVATQRITDSMRRNPGEALTEVVNKILMGFPPGSSAR